MLRSWMAKPTPKRKAKVAHDFCSTPTQMNQEIRSSRPVPGRSIFSWTCTRIMPRRARPRRMSRLRIRSWVRTTRTAGAAAMVEDMTNRTGRDQSWRVERASGPLVRAGRLGGGVAPAAWVRSAAGRHHLGSFGQVLGPEQLAADGAGEEVLAGIGAKKRSEDGK